MDRSIKELLLTAYKSSNMELAEFGLIFDHNKGKAPLPTTENEVTSFIRQHATDLYIRSWLVTPLKDALDKLGFEKERREVDVEVANDHRTWSNRDKGAE